MQIVLDNFYEMDLVVVEICIVHILEEFVVALCKFG